MAELPDPLSGLPTPPQFPLAHGWAAVINGVGGTGVVTVAAILGMAAHLEGKGCGMIDMAGLAQKGGAVFTHLRIAPRAQDISAIRVPAGGADLVLAGDLVVAGHRSVLGAARAGATSFIVNSAETMPGEFTRHADLSLPAERLKRAIAAAAGSGNAVLLDATAMARALFGVTSPANMILLGAAFQKGAVPLTADAIEQAVRLNGEAPAINIAAFRWGRRAAHAPDDVAALCRARSLTPEAPADATLDAIVARRAAFLADYQNTALADRYKAAIAGLAEAEARACDGATVIAQAAARSLFKLMATKDEYEVARLYTDGSFKRQLAREFASHGRLEFHLAPPLLARCGADGRPAKMRFGPWMAVMFRVLAAMKGLRGTWLDPFGRTAERRMERALLAQFETDLGTIAARLSARNAADMLELAGLPQMVRGYGHVKEASAAAMAEKRALVLARLAADGPQRQAAAE